MSQSSSVQRAPNPSPAPLQLPGVGVDVESYPLSSERDSPKTHELKLKAEAEKKVKHDYYTKKFTVIGKIERLHMLTPTGSLFALVAASVQLMLLPRTGDIARKCLYWTGIAYTIFQLVLSIVEVQLVLSSKTQKTDRGLILRIVYDIANKVVYMTHIVFFFIFPQILQGSRVGVACLSLGLHLLISLYTQYRTAASKRTTMQISFYNPLLTLQLLLLVLAEDNAWNLFYVFSPSFLFILIGLAIWSTVLGIMMLGSKKNSVQSEKSEANTFEHKAKCSMAIVYSAANFFFCIGLIMICLYLRSSSSDSNLFIIIAVITSAVGAVVTGLTFTCKSSSVM
jgi:hypothetical protein